MPNPSKGEGNRVPKEGYKAPPGMPGKPSMSKSDKSRSPKESYDTKIRDGGSGGAKLDPRYNE